MRAEKLDLYREYPQPDEESVAQSIVALMQSQMIKNSRPGRTLRDVHSKHHGCVRGYFLVEPDLPEELRVGVFETPRRYHAWIRFSNSGAFAPVGGVASDFKRDARGMAIKLLDVPGEKLLEDERDATTQDFLLFTPKMFFTAGPGDFHNLMIALTTHKLAMLWYLITHPAVTLALYRSLKKHGNVLELQYYSAVPYAFGSKAAKYSAKPQRPRATPLPHRPTDKFLRERMIHDLAESDVSFDFMVQLQTDPYVMPIENGLAVWNEALSPFRKVATLVIPKQQFDSPEQRQCCENSSFTPWHSLPEHRPLGALNRVRRIVYQKISEFRHLRNGQPRREPAGVEPCAQK